jgi:hypothetical protein
MYKACTRRGVVLGADARQAAGTARTSGVDLSGATAVDMTDWRAECKI